VFLFSAFLFLYILLAVMFTSWVRRNSGRPCDCGSGRCGNRRPRDCGRRRGFIPFPRREEHFLAVLFPGASFFDGARALLPDVVLFRAAYGDLLFFAGVERG
jgi:hypothetical protein